MTEQPSRGDFPNDTTAVDGVNAEQGSQDTADNGDQATNDRNRDGEATE